MPTNKIRTMIPIEPVPLAVAGWDVTPGEEGRRSGVTPAILGTVARYASLVESAARDLAAVLDRGEWNAIADANNGCADLWDYGDGPQLSPLTLLWANVHDSEGLGEKWGIDARGLVRKLKALGPHHGEAILAAVRWFWDHCAEVDHQAHDWWTPSYRRAAVKE